jgi:arabinose-5-phosphate isomerase
MIVEQAKEVLRVEAEGILGLIERIGPEFESAVEVILNAKGRVILTGIGKSGLIGRKIASTLNSTGTPAIFLHPVEAMHGDLGTVTMGDIIVAVSKSGQTSEINVILPILRKMGAKLIGFTGMPASPMAQLCDIVIDVGVEKEACPLGLAPTASSTAALAMGDALAVALINRRRFESKDFRRFHPGGSLGERLAIKVREVMITGERIPMVVLGSPMRRAIREMDSKRLGATLVVDEEERLAGIITDGDLRRVLLKEKDIHHIPVEEVMSSTTKTIDEDQTAADALGIMERHAITHLAIVDEHKKVKGIVHLHDVLGRENFRLNGSLLPNQETIR